MDTEDFNRVIESYGDLVFRIARARMTTQEDAEDIYQEVFITYAQKLPRFPNEDAERAWFARTVSNLCKSKWRSIQRHPAESLDAAANVAVEDPDYTELRAALNKLPDKYRRPIELFYFADLTVETVAKELGISPNAIRIRLSRARKMLEDWLKE